MIKKCKIVAINDVVMVIDYAGTLVQLPATHTTDDFVFVKRNTENKFFIVSEDDFKRQYRTVSVSDK